MPRANWKIYYGDGSTYSDLDGPPEAAPKLNVQVVAVPDERVGVYFRSQADYYWYDFDQERWLGADLFGLWDYLVRPGYKVVAFGRTIPNVEYDKIIATALEDSELPPKSAWDDSERRGGSGAEIDTSSKG